MWPLLKRDGLSVQYIASLLLWNRIIGHNPFRRPTESLIQFLSVVRVLGCGRFEHWASLYN